MSTEDAPSPVHPPARLCAAMRVLSRATGFAAVVVFTLLTLDVLLGVFSRYIGGVQVRWTEELATFLLVWLAFLGASIAYIEDAHLGIDLFVSKLHPVQRLMAHRIVHFIVLVFVVSVLVYGGTLLSAERWDSAQMMPTLGIRKAWLYMAAPVNGFIMSLSALAKIISPCKAEHFTGEEC